MNSRINFEHNMDSLNVPLLFTTPQFKQQLAAGALKWYLCRNKFSGIKLHPKKKQIRFEYAKYYHMRSKAPIHEKNNVFICELTKGLQSIIELYIDNWDTTASYATRKSNIHGCKKHQILCNIQQNIRCVICLDDVCINKCKRTGNILNMNDVIVCSGPASHIYHHDCYIEFLKMEQNKDKHKKYKCESDTLCITCFQPICL